MASWNEQVDKAVEHCQLVEVCDIGLQFVVEAAISEAVEDFFTLVDWRIRVVGKYNLFDLVVSLDQDCHV